MIKQWEKLTNKIAEQFLIKYFDIQKEDIEEGIDWEWVNNRFQQCFRMLE